MAKQPGLDDRHRDKSGETSRKHGNTRVDTLREEYGHEFAADFRGVDDHWEVREFEPAKKPGR